MKRSRIMITEDVPGVLSQHKAALIRKTIRTALEVQGVTLPCEVNVLLTDDAGIHKINLEMRDVDRPTDVLSFPMFDFAPNCPPTEETAGDLVDWETGLLPIGDMAISMERVAAQAQEYGHSRQRELCYLVTHSVLHLLGYDHMDEGPMKEQMRRREEEILTVLGMER